MEKKTRNTVRFVLIIALLLVLASALLTYAVQGGRTATAEVEVERSVEQELWQKLPAIVSVFMLAASLLMIILAALIHRHHQKNRKPY